MELEPIVGASCAQCQKKVLVDADGRNCKRCGLAIHRSCGKAHREACAGKAVKETQRHDYDEVKAIAWTGRLTAVVSGAAFLVAFGIGAMVNGGGDAPPAAGVATVASTPPPPLSTGQLVLRWGAIGAGAVVGIGGYLIERRRQGLE